MICIYDVRHTSPFKQIDHLKVISESWYFMHGSGPSVIRYPGPCLTTTTWRCRKNSSQWKLRCHRLEFLQQRQIAVVSQGPGPLFTKRLDTVKPRSREASKPRVSCLDFSKRSEIWQTHRQRHCRDACQIAERYDHHNTQSRGFGTYAKTFYRLVNTGPDDLLPQSYAIAKIKPNITRVEWVVSRDWICPDLWIIWWDLHASNL